MKFEILIDCPKCKHHPVEVLFRESTRNYYVICMTCGHSLNHWTNYETAVNEWNNQVEGEQ